MMYRRPVLTGSVMLAGAALLGVGAGALFVQGVFATFERPLTHWYHSRNH